MRRTRPEVGTAFTPPQRNPKTVAVILGAGVGARMGLGIPKQFVPVAGRTSLEHTVDIFNGCDFIDELIVMMEPGWIKKAEQLLPRSRYSKLRAILPGGADRNATSFLALQSIAEPDAKVIFHDAVRPLIDVSIIKDCVDALDSYGAVDTGIPSADTIIEVDDRDVLVGVPPRASLRRGQTPQAFRHSVITQAYLLARDDPAFTATDDCSVVLKYLPEVPIIVVPGHEANIKITHPIDIHLVDKLFQLKHRTVAPVPQPKTSMAGASVVVFGGSSGIGAEVVRQLEEQGARVHSHSRSTSGVFVEDRAAIARALAEAAAEFGAVHHVVLTAGLLTIGNLVDMSDEEVQQGVAVNLLAPLMVAQEAHPYLALSGGSLLLYSSSSYTRGRAKYTVYSATKAAVVNLTQALADEWSEDHIRVNCISPSRTATPMRLRAFGVEDEESLVQAAAVARVSLEVLASDATGQVFDVRVPQTDPLASALEPAQ